MGKIISASWVENDDPMFAEKVATSSKKQSQKKEASSNLQRRLDKRLSQGFDDNDPVVIALRNAIRREENTKSFRNMWIETLAARSDKKRLI